MGRSIFFAIFVMSSFMASAGETAMNNMERLLFSDINKTSLDAVRKDLDRVCLQVRGGQTPPLDANREIFAIFQKHPPEAVLLTYLSSDVLSENLLSDRNLPGETRAAYVAARKVGKSLAECGDMIAHDVSANTPAGRYLEQATDLNASLVARTGLGDFDPGSVDDFRDFMVVASILQNAMGYKDYQASHPQDAYWPSGDYFKGRYNFIDLFRTSEAEQAKNRVLEATFGRLPGLDQALLYAWVYDVNFEEVFAGSEIPDDLPPWIENADLRELHQRMNHEIMAAFQKQETGLIED